MKVHTKYEYKHTKVQSSKTYLGTMLKQNI